MTTENQSVLIVGAGECGARAAFALRENGHAGRIVLIGTEALHPYERPPLSKAALAADAMPTHVAPRERFEEHGIDLLTGVSATAIDPAAKTADLSSGATISFDVALIATGVVEALFTPVFVGHYGGRCARCRLTPEARNEAFGLKPKG